MKERNEEQQATKITYQGYSWGLKISIIEEIENGQVSINQAAKKYGVSRTAIQKWMKKYGNLDKKLREMGGRSPKQEIAELKKKLKQAELERDILETALEIIEDEYGVDVKKKFLSQYQRDTLKKQKKG
jgi:transposase-like protein